MHIQRNNESTPSMDSKEPKPVNSSEIEWSKKMIEMLCRETSQSLSNCAIALKNANGNFAEAKRKLLECNALIQSILPASILFPEFYNRT